MTTDFSLRPWYETDLASLVRYAGNPRIAQSLTNAFPHPYTEEDGREFLAMSIGNPGLRAIYVDGEAVGSIGIFPQTDVHERNAEMGYWLAEPFWGRGIMPRAVQEMVVHGFATFPDVTRIFARPFSTNQASHRVLEKAGFTLEARLRDTIYKNGAYMDELIFAIRRDRTEK